MIPHSRIPHRKGFALVSALMLMVLLTIVAVGLLSLATVTLRTSGQGDAAAIARSNARLALMLAIGDLQKQAGPDKRVTATASILQGSGSSVPTNDKWVGVWRSDGLKSDANTTTNSFVRADTRGGSGYNDSRGKGTVYSAADQCVAWLVSGSEPNPNDTLTEANSVEVRSGAAPIRVPKVSVNQSNAGSLAYYVSDESTKARVSLADPYYPDQPSAKEPSAVAMRRWVVPQTADAKVFFQGSPLKAEEAAKVISQRQLELTSLASGMVPSDFRKLCKQYADDFTAYGRSVLADPVQGGLKRDLTAYLEGDAAPALGTVKGITDTLAINGDLGTTRTKSGPKFGMLRNWYGLRNQISQSNGEPTIAAQIPRASGQGKIDIVDPGAAFTTPELQPVMTEAVYYLNHVLDGDTSSLRMVELIYPRVVLWNPFSVKLKTEGHVVLFDFSANTSITCSFKTADGKDGTATLSTSTAGHPERLLGFYVPPTTFEPGEALTFCATTKNRQFFDSNLRNNPLSATSSPANLGCFSRTWDKSNIGASVNTNSVVFDYNFNGNVYWNYNKVDGRTQTITLHALSGSGAVTGGSLLSNSGPVAVRQLSMDNYSRGNNGRWLPQYTKRTISKLTDVISGNVPPDSLLAYGGRFRFLYETYANRTQGAPFNEPWYYAPLAHHNINAPNIHRWPNDNIFGMRYNAVAGTGGSGPHLYSYGPLAQARQWSEWLDSEVMPHRGPSGNYRTAVFSDASFATSDSVYPVYDLPLPEVPLTSIAALQHVPLSPFAWHPTHAIGNSIPSPFVPITNATSNSRTNETKLWTDKTATLSTNNDITGFSSVPNEVLLNDLSYELNQSLWDRYFLSAIPRSGSGWKGNKWDPSQPLPNSRLTIDPARSNGGDKSEIADFHRAARSLWLEGGFNVNSTSVNAWRSILRSFRDIEVPSFEGNQSGSGSGAAFPGQIISCGTSSERALDPSRDNFWRDYRRLSDDEIDNLAAGIVEQVRNRAPFAGVADFVNRRLAESSDTKRLAYAFGGVIQTAMDKIPSINGNGSANKDLLMPTSSAAGNFEYGADYWGGPIATPQTQTYQVFHGTPGGSVLQKGRDASSQISQADILQQIGSILVARGDTFVVRAYGEAKDAKGNVTARAWCEAVVQRTQIPVNPDPASNNLNPLIKSGETDWGRRYEIESFRWIDGNEV